MGRLLLLIRPAGSHCHIWASVPPTLKPHIARWRQAVIASSSTPATADLVIRLWSHLQLLARFHRQDGGDGRRSRCGRSWRSRSVLVTRGIAVDGSFNSLNPALSL